MKIHLCYSVQDINKRNKIFVIVFKMVFKIQIITTLTRDLQKNVYCVTKYIKNIYARLQVSLIKIQILNNNSKISS